MKLFCNLARVFSSPFNWNNSNTFKYMKLKLFVSLLFAGSCALSSMAQGYKDGIEYYKADRVAQAEELLLRNLNNADTDKAASYYYLGLISIDRYNHNLRQNKPDANLLTKAKQYFNDGLSANPDYPFNYIGLGQLDLMKGDSKAAEDNFKKAEKLGDKDAGVLAGIARAYYNVDPNLYAKQMNKYRESAKKLVTNRVLSKKREFKENDADYYILEGDILFNSANGDSKIVGDACNMYEQAIGIDPSTGEGYVKYADTYFTIKRNDFAISKLEEMIAKNPNSALGQRELAEKLYEDGQVARAVQEYAKLIQNPNHFDSDETRYLSLIYFVNDYDKGYNEATKMLSKNPDNFTARRFQYIFSNLGGKDNSIQLAEELLKRKSDKNSFATGDYSMIASDLIKNGKTDEALAVLQMGMKDYPNEPSILKGAADTYRAAEMYDKAADAYAAYIDAQKKKTGSVSPIDLWNLSTMGFYAGAKATEPADIDKYWAISVKAAQDAIDQLAPESQYMAAKRIGDIARYSKNEADAIAAYEKAIKMMEDANVTDDAAAAKDMYRYLTVTYYQNKDNANAKKYFDKYVSLEPNDEDMNKFGKLLK